jgi:hypothetical protein
LSFFNFSRRLRLHVHDLGLGQQVELLHLRQLEVVEELRTDWSGDLELQDEYKDLHSSEKIELCQSIGYTPLMIRIQQWCAYQRIPGMEFL